MAEINLKGEDVIVRVGHKAKALCEGIEITIAYGVDTDIIFTWHLNGLFDYSWRLGGFK